jgi:hypothetical protein
MPSLDYSKEIVVTPYLAEQLEILRRIAERGLRLAQGPGSGDNAPDTVYVDLFQHLLDEIARTKSEAL